MSLKKNPSFDPDVKVRRWGPSSTYGITPITEAGRKWVDDWLLKQTYLCGTSHDGAVLFWEQHEEEVSASILEHRLNASLGLGPNPVEGMPYVAGRS